MQVLGTIFQQHDPEHNLRFGVPLLNNYGLSKLAILQLQKTNVHVQNIIYDCVDTLYTKCICMH